MSDDRNEYYVNLSGDEIEELLEKQAVTVPHGGIDIRLFHEIYDADDLRRTGERLIEIGKDMVAESKLTERKERAKEEGGGEVADPQ